MIFLCPESDDFQHNFDKCEDCDIVGTCKVYKYEIQFQDELNKKKDKEIGR
jgi:hypothetical protein